jgi:hypothetical protein
MKSVSHMAAKVVRDVGWTQEEAAALGQLWILEGATNSLHTFTN